MQEQTVYKRKKLYIKPGFQSKMMIIMILVVVIAANLVGGLCFLLISSTMEDEFISKVETRRVVQGAEPVLSRKIVEYVLPKVAMAEVITILLLLFLTLKLTHYIAGPVYRLEQNMLEMARGRLKLRTTLRHRDEFTEVADALNLLSETYVERLENIQHKVSMLEYSELTPEQKKVLNEMKELLVLEPKKNNDDNADENQA
jgi:methyl-accepting chemotaxis protein